MPPSAITPAALAALRWRVRTGRYVVEPALVAEALLVKLADCRVKDRRRR